MFKTTRVINNAKLQLGVIILLAIANMEVIIKYPPKITFTPKSIKEMIL